MNPNPKNAIFGRMYSRLKPVTNVSENPNLKNLGKMLGAELSWPVLKKKVQYKKIEKVSGNRIDPKTAVTVSILWSTTNCSSFAARLDCAY